MKQALSGWRRNILNEYLLPSWGPQLRNGQDLEEEQWLGNIGTQRGVTEKRLGPLVVAGNSWDPEWGLRNS